MATQIPSPQSKKKRKTSLPAVEKAHWDPNTTSVFIQVCVDEAHAGNKPLTHFTKVGWDNIMRRFSEETKRPYTRIQLKNRWDILKKDLGIWKALLQGETDITYDHKTGMIDASDEWWEFKLQRFPEAVKIREKGVPQPDDLDFLFCDAIATPLCCAPISSVLPTHMHENEIESDNEYEFDVPTSDDVVSDMEQPLMLDRTSLMGNVTAGKQQTPRQQGRTHAKLPSLLHGNLDPLESSTGTSAEGGQTDFSISKVMKILHSVPGVVPGDRLFMLATLLFLRHPFREMFVSLQESKLRFLWLQELMADYDRRSSGSCSGASCKCCKCLWLS